ncbi:hypothetical protein [Kitasatospora aureofaciens]|uniref:hypothetical protein n=1 Tax=Kitasatospora aureofaciens TaxID=1894 RepID=UPI0033FF381A
MSETVELPTGRASMILALGRIMAERYQRDNGIGYHLAVQTAPTIYREALEEAAREEQYYAKCNALGGISADDAKQILNEIVAFADKQHLPMDALWERAWQKAIDKSMA